jgi:hypothetical protein
LIAVEKIEGCFGSRNFFLSNATNSIFAGIKVTFSRGLGLLDIRFLGLWSFCFWLFGLFSRSGLSLGRRLLRRTFLLWRRSWLFRVGRIAFACYWFARHYLDIIIFNKAIK